MVFLGLHLLTTFFVLATGSRKIVGLQAFNMTIASPNDGGGGYFRSLALHHVESVLKHTTSPLTEPST